MEVIPIQISPWISEKIPFSEEKVNNIFRIGLKILGSLALLSSFALYYSFSATPIVAAGFITFIICFIASEQFEFRLPPTSPEKPEWKDLDTTTPEAKRRLAPYTDPDCSHPPIPYDQVVELNRQNHHNPLVTLPSEIFLHILEYLDDPADVCRLAMTCTFAKRQIVPSPPLRSLQANLNVILRTIDHYDRIIRLQTEGKFKVAIDPKNETSPAICVYEFFSFNHPKWKEEEAKSPFVFSKRKLEVLQNECLDDAIHALAEFNIDQTFFTKKMEHVLGSGDESTKRTPHTSTSLDYRAISEDPEVLKKRRLLETLPKPATARNSHATITPTEVVAKALNTLTAHFFLVPTLRERMSDAENALPIVDTWFTSPEEDNWERYYRYKDLISRGLDTPPRIIICPPISIQKLKDKQEGDRVILPIRNTSGVKIIARCMGSQYRYSEYFGPDFARRLRDLFEPDNPWIHYESRTDRFNEQMVRAREFLSNEHPPIASEF